jgi:putative hemin transport protein
MHPVEAPTPQANDGADAAAFTRERYREARRAGATRHRDIAAALGISEAELIAAHVLPLEGPRDEGPGLNAVRLRPEWPALVAAMPELGEVMALTRNASCVHEKTGCYEQVSGDGPVGLVLGPEIDLRVFYRQWHHGFAVHESFADATKPDQRSLQFFDACGTAIHKVFARPATHLAAWLALTSRFVALEQQSGGRFAAPVPPVPPQPDAAIDVPAFRQAWASLRDTHEFFGLLKTHGVTRTQALRLAEPRFAQPVDAGSARELLQAAAGSGTPIMVFVGNPGLIQIHGGPVKHVKVLGPWLNVLDARFNLHLREDHIAQSWVVRKPTSDGMVTSLELFDSAGDTIAMFFGERKPGRPELCTWRVIADRLVADPAWLAEEGACTHC